MNALDLDLDIDVDLADVRHVIIAVAERVLTQRQLEIFVLHVFAGQSVGEIARCLNVTQPTVSIALNGQPNRSPGIIKKMGDAVKEDPAFQETIRALKEPPPEKKAKGGEVVGWYRGARPDDFSALAVLHYASALADKTRRLSMTSLQRDIPPRVVSEAIPRLRVQGWIATDGIDITILKTPTVGEGATQ
jgi:hypothetical protein